MTQNRLTSQKPAIGKTILRYAIYLLAWLLLSTVAFALFFSIRANFFNLGMELRLNPWQVRGIDRFYIFGFGMGWFIFMLWVENYLRVGVEKQQLKKRILRVTTWEVALLALSILLQLPYGIDLPFLQ